MRPDSGSGAGIVASPVAYDPRFRKESVIGSLEFSMPYIVTEACIKCKYTDCVEVCPVDCFYEGENMLVIHPDECIDCGVCEPECPIEAIVPDSDPRAEALAEMNKDFSEIWPNITRKKPAPADADDWKDVPNKYADHFSDKPGS